MRICPTCGDVVASTLRCCPRCTGPLPEPRTGYGGRRGTPANPGIPRRPATSRLLMPRRLTTSRLPTSRSPGIAWSPGIGPEPYGPGAVRASGVRGCHRAAKRSGTGSPAQARRPAGFPPGTPRNPRPLPEEDTASRLLYAPPGRPHPAPRHRARIAGAVLGTVALLAGVITAWAVFGQDRATPGPRLAGRQATATRRASPAARATPSPSPPARPPAMAPSWWPWRPG